LVLGLGCSERDDTTDQPTGNIDGVALSVEPNTPNPPQTLTFSSQILGETRRVYVQLPEGYARSRNSYPVLVVLDGEWLFELARAHARFSSEPYAMGPSIPRMIVVGIEGTDRDRDFTPTKNSGWEHEFTTAGGADDFLRFLDEELFPLVDREYRTNSSRVIAGWSFGGLFAMYSAIAAPELFDAHLCISPAIWWDSDLVYKLFEDRHLDRTKRMVVTLGAEEEGGIVHTSTKRIMARFDAEPVENLEVSLIEFEGVGHSWGIPSAFDEGLRALFPGFVMPTDEAVTLDRVETYYEDLSHRWGFHVDPPEGVMYQLALAQEDKEDAIAIIDRLLEYEPDASLAYFYKGRFRHKLEQNDEALEAYREAIAAELRGDAPLGLRLRWYHEAIDEIAG
jgi:predicted alpha/beta superfamily hydrolase